MSLALFLSVGFLEGEELSFAVSAPAVAGELAAGADDAVTGDDDGEEVGAAGGADGANGFGGADGFGDLGVGPGFAAGDFEESLPDALLEGGGANVEGEGLSGGMFGETGEDKGYRFDEVLIGCGKPEDGLGKLFAELDG